MTIKKWNPDAKEYEPHEVPSTTFSLRKNNPKFTGIIQNYNPVRADN